MTPRPALAATIAASLLVLGATGALAAGSPQLSGHAPDKTSPTTAPVGAPTTTVAAAARSADDGDDNHDDRAVAQGPPIGDVVDVGNAKPPRFYDAYLAAGLADIQAWWASEFPRLYGEPWTPLEGGIFAAYPERTAPPIPGCGFPGDTSYQEVSDYGAFYCPDGDYMAYDDGELGIIHELAERFSPSVVAVVMAHEFGHAVQFRSDELDRNVPTIYTEQQADCFSGAWARRVWEGQVAGLTFGDEDIRTGLIALVAVADPIGTSVLEPGGHGAAFDRIGAFQEGFIGGIDNCVGLIEKPLPLLPNEFARGSNDQLDERQRAIRLGQWRDHGAAVRRPLSLLAGAGRHGRGDDAAVDGSRRRRPVDRQLRRPGDDGQLRRRVLRGDQRGAVRRGARAGAVRRLRRLRRRLRDRPGLGRSRPEWHSAARSKASPGRWRRTAWSGRGSAHGSSSIQGPGRPVTHRSGSNRRRR